MKTIKIILGIVIVLTLVFLGTGFVVPKITYTATVEIDKPINEVFTLFQDQEKIKEWLPEVKSIKPIEEKEGVVGSTYLMSVDNQGETITMTEKITAYVPNKQIVFQFDSDQMLKIDDYNFMHKGNKTIVVQQCIVQAKSYMMSCVFPWFKGTLKGISEQYMNQFKLYVEQ